MKNFHFKNRGLWLGIALSCTVLLMVPLITGAAPATDPPTGNLTPTFSGLNINTGTITNLNIDTNGNISTGTTANPVTVKDLQGFKVNNTTNDVFTVDTNGSLSNPSGTNPVTINDALKVVGSGSTNVDMTVNGRIKTGDANNYGGVWLGSTADLFVGQYNSTTLGFWNAGNWRFIIDNLGKISNPNGNVVINDSLEVAGAGGATVDMTVNGRIRTGDASNTGGIWLGNPANLFVGATGIATELGFYNNGVWRFTVDSQGNTNMDSGTLYIDGVNNRVGLGTYSPSSRLDVNGAIRGTTIGDFYFNYGTLHTPTDKWDSCYQKGYMGGTPNHYCVMDASCNSGDIAINGASYNISSWSQAPQWYLFHEYLSSTGYVAVYNAAAADWSNSAGTWRVGVLCFSPDG
jgi:hypothetical protein